MATTTWTCNKDAVTADNGTSLGAGAMNYLPVGNYSGYDYRAFLGFPWSFSGMVSITSAILHMKTTGQVKVAFGSDPDLNIQRINGSWSEGSAASLSGSNAIERSNEPGVTGATVTWDVTTAENTWDTVDITTIIQEAFAANDFDGLRLVPIDSGSDEVTEFYAREYGSNDAYIVVTYTTNTLPSAPTLTAPAASATKVSRTPTFTFTHVDAEGDACAKYKIEVMTGAGSGTTMWASGDQTSGISGTSITRAYAGTALANNTTYYWRAATSDAAGYGAWSGWRAFTTVKLPTATLTQPAASSIAAKLSYTAGSGWSTPRLNVGWTFACGDGGTQTHYEVEVGTSSGGGQIYNPDLVAGAVTSLVVPANLTDDQHVYVRVRVKCSHGEVSAWSSEYLVGTRWAMARYYKNVGTITAWSISGLATTVGATSSVVVEYNSSASSTALTSGYQASLASVPINTYFHYRVWLMAWGSASPTSPSFDAITLNYSTNVLSPDHWTLPTGGSIDVAQRVYGTQSLRIDGTGTSSDRRAYQAIKVEPDTHYTFQCRIKTLGDANAKMLISTGALTGAVLATEDVVRDTNDWTRYTFGWDSGSNSDMYIQLGVFGAAGTSAWFDAVKVEASNVATPWSPGFLGDGVVLDAGGLNIDGYNGGVLRVRDYSGSVALKQTTGGFVLDALATDQYAALVFADQGAKRIYLDYGTSTTDDFRILTATGAAGAESATERFRIVANTGTVLLPAGADAALSSTDHPFQIGPTSGANIIMDANELMARNNGAASTLYLNYDGGDVLIKSGEYSNIRGVSCLTFAFTTVPGTGAQDCYYGDADRGIVQLRVPFACEVVGISISLTAARTAGTLTFQGWNGSTSALVGMTAQINGTTTNLQVATDTVTGTPDFAAQQILRLRMTGSGYTPTATAGIAWVYLAHYAE